MKIIKTGLMLIAWVIVSMVIAKEIKPRYKCNVLKRDARAVVATATDRTTFESIESARRTISRLEPCISNAPGDWEINFILASLYHLAGAFAPAERFYQAALVLEERPEIYASLGTLYIEKGHTEAAVTNIEKAVLFNIGYAYMYSPHLRDQLLQTYVDRRAQLLRRAVEKRGTNAE
jgi:tetratricopeptide (TPR) repeat protein